MAEPTISAAPLQIQNKPKHIVLVDVIALIHLTYQGVKLVQRADKKCLLAR